MNNEMERYQPQEMQPMNQQQQQPGYPAQQMPYGQGQPVHVHNYAPMRRANRSKTVAILLALFLGGLGAHKFYLGQGGMGVLYLLFFWTWIPAIAAFVEAIIYATKSDEEFDRLYNY